MIKTITLTGLCLITLYLPIFSQEIYVGCIYKLSGKVEIYYSAADKWQKAYQYAPLNEKDKIRTYKSAYCDIVLQDGSAIRVNEMTEIEIKSLKLINKRQKYNFDVKSGKILGLFGKRTSIDSSMKVYTPTAVMAVRGTDFAVNVTTDITNVGLFEGELSITTRTDEEVIPTEEIILTPDKEAVIEKDKKPKVEERLSKFMEKEKQRLAKVKEYIEEVRKKLQERETYLQECIKKQQERLKKLETEQQERLKKLEEKRQERLKKSE